MNRGMSLASCSSRVCSAFSSACSNAIASCSAANSSVSHRFVLSTSAVWCQPLRPSASGVSNQSENVSTPRGRAIREIVAVRSDTRSGVSFVGLVGYFMDGRPCTEVGLNVDPLSGVVNTAVV